MLFLGFVIVSMPVTMTLDVDKAPGGFKQAADINKEVLEAFSSINERIVPRELIQAAKILSPVNVPRAGMMLGMQIRKHFEIKKAKDIIEGTVPERKPVLRVATVIRQPLNPALRIPAKIVHRSPIRVLMPRMKLNPIMPQRTEPKRRVGAE